MDHHDPQLDHQLTSILFLVFFLTISYMGHVGACTQRDMLHHFSRQQHAVFAFFCLSLAPSQLHVIVGTVLNGQRRRRGQN